MDLFEIIKTFIEKKSFILFFWSYYSIGILLCEKKIVMDFWIGLIMDAEFKYGGNI